MGKPNKLYGRLPIWAQDIAVSVYGVRRAWQRYGGGYRRYLKGALERQWWNEEQLAAYQHGRLVDLVAHAKRHTRWFAQSYADINPAELRSVRQLPFLEKDTYRTRLDDCVADCWPRSRLMESHTSGSTGTPLTYFGEREDFRERMAFLERQYRWAGVRSALRHATITGNLVVPRAQTSAPFWRHNMAGNQLLLSSYHLTEERMPAYARKLAGFNPEFVEGYPSAVDTVAAGLERLGLVKAIRPRAVLVTAESLHLHQAERIRRVFGCEVFNYYGSSEGAPMITQCEAGCLHVNPDCGIFEFLRADGSEAGPGEEAELVVTNFASRAQPLIRYRVRDAVIPESEGLCSCGRYFRRIRSIIGRLDDMIWTRDRGWIGRLSQSIKVFPGSVREAQIVQSDVDTLIIRLVRDPLRYSEEQLNPLWADLRHRVGEKISFRVEYVDEIPKGANNKFKFVVNALPAELKLRLQRGERP